MTPGRLAQSDPGGVAARLEVVRARIAAAARRAGRDPATIRLVAVSKYADVESVQAAYAAGQREFGESYIQEALPRLEALPGDVLWHLVGHLQSNKVNKALGRFDLVQSLDSSGLARALSEKSLARELVTPVLVQVNCTGESSKSGVEAAGAEDFVLSLREMRGILVRGLMGIGPLSGGEPEIRASFRLLAELFRRLRARDLPELPLDTLSMGMSGDYEIAVEEGATLIRIGAAIFAP